MTSTDYDAIKLGVNIDHVATLRQVRGVNYPDVVAAARTCMHAGAHGITVHLREDRRHIQDADVYALSAMPEVPLNLEMACSQDIVAIALEICPNEVCLVPEKREELTTEGGLDVVRQRETLAPVCQDLAAAGIVVSLFIEPDPIQIEAAAALGVPVVELHTGTFCNARGNAAQAALNTLIDGAMYARTAGLQVNAGHGITLDNIGDILKIPHLDTLNIGHSIVSQAVFDGLENAVRAMLDAMHRGAGHTP